MRKFLYIFLISVLSFPDVSDAKSDFEKVASVVTDPLKAAEGTSNLINVVRDVKAMLLAVQNEFDLDIRDYLSDIDKKILSIDLLVERNIIVASTEILKIEEKIFNDVIVLLRTVECVAAASSNTAANDLRNTLPSFFKEDSKKIQLPFGTENKKILGGLIIPFTRHPKTIEIDLSVERSPSLIFYEIEKAFLKSFEDMSMDDHPKLLAEAYNELSRYARKTQCYYDSNSAAFKILFKKYAKYNYEAEMLLQAGFL